MIKDKVRGEKTWHHWNINQNHHYWLNKCKYKLTLEQLTSILFYLIFSGCTELLNIQLGSLEFYKNWIFRSRCGVSLFLYCHGNLIHVNKLVELLECSWETGQNSTVTPICKALHCVRSKLSKGYRNQCGRTSSKL